MVATYPDRYLVQNCFSFAVARETHPLDRSDHEFGGNCWLKLEHSYSKSAVNLGLFAATRIHEEALDRLQHLS